MSEPEIEIAVVGAHLSGMPLNGELASRGGRLLRATETEAIYTLSALPGGPPKRPGLLRVGEGAGHAIAVEVWSLPAAGFGTLPQEWWHFMDKDYKKIPFIATSTLPTELQSMIHSTR